MTIAELNPDTSPLRVNDLLAWRSEELPRIDFLLALRRYWMTDLFAAVRRDYDTACRGRPAPETMAEAEPIVLGLDSVRRFLFLDRYIQNRLWEEMERMAPSRLPALQHLLAPADGDLGSLDVVPEFDYPGYYTEVDFHRQSGGIWRNDAGAVIYAMGARVIHVGKNDAFELHERFTVAIPDNQPQRIVDLGCGFGKSTFSLKTRWPGAEVHGVDLSAPCLRLARRLATERGLDIAWRQADAEVLPDADESCDIATCTMTLHELPPDAVAAVVREAHRVLRPGGLLVTLENRYIGDPLRDLLFVYHSDQIDERFWQPFRQIDLAEVAREAGFGEVGVAPWYGMGGSAAELDGDPSRWFTPWGMLVARKT